MGATHIDEDVTTAFVDLGSGVVPILVLQPIASVKAALKDGWVAGDSPIGEVHFTKDSVKFLQAGRREPLASSPGTNPVVNSMIR